MRTMASGLRPLLLTGLALAALPLLGPASPARADKVGVAAAVNPDAFSQGTEVKIGNSIFYNQRINTTGSGLVQVLLVDGSTFTVGPGSDLVIDKFVYDPTKNKGEMVATLGKGVLRFVGGKLSKNEGGVTVNTPTGALAIRGGMFHLSVDGHKVLASFLFGNHMTITDGGTSKNIFEIGYTYDDGTVRPTTSRGHGLLHEGAVRRRPSRGRRHSRQKDTAAPHETAKVDVNEIKQDGTSDAVQGDLQNQEQQPTPQQGNVRVLTNANFYTAFIGTPNEQNLSNPDVLPGRARHPRRRRSRQARPTTSPPRQRKRHPAGSRPDRPVRHLQQIQRPSRRRPQTSSPSIIVGTLDLPAVINDCDNFGVCPVTDGRMTGTSTASTATMPSRSNHPRPAPPCCGPGFCCLSAVRAVQ